MDGAKSLEMQHLWTRRRIGSGTVTQSCTEQERSVPAPGYGGWSAVPGAPVTVKPISGTPVKWRNAGRKSEEVVVAVTQADNITLGSEGPLAGCAAATAKALVAEEPRGPLGPGANLGGIRECDRPTAWGKAG